MPPGAMLSHSPERLAPSQLQEHMGAAVPEYVNVTELTSGNCGSAHVRVELARRQTLCHPSGDCDNTVPDGTRFPSHSGTFYS